MNSRLKSRDILETMTYIEDSYIESAMHRLGYLTEEKGDKKPILLIAMRRVAIFVGVLILAASTTVATAMAFNEDFREEVKAFVFELFSIEEKEMVPEISDEMISEDTEITTDNMYVNPQKSFLGGVIEGRYVHAPASGNAKEGVYTICTDEIELNQGSHYDAYYEENGEFIKLEEHTFSGNYTVLGNNFQIAFEWAEHNGQVVLTYIGAEENYRIPANPGPKENMLVELMCYQSAESGERAGTAYPVLLDLTTGELKDVLAGTGAEQLANLANQAVSEDYSKMLLAQSDGTLYYVDLQEKQFYSVEELSGERADACSLIGNTLSCWVLEEEGYRAWTIDLTTFARKELFAQIPNAMGDSGEKAGIVYLSGFDTTIHWGTMFTGSVFALEQDASGAVTVIDLATGERIPVEGLVWPARKYTDVVWDSSPDGRRLLICGGEVGAKYEYTGVLDFEKMRCLEFSRENRNKVNEWRPYWFDRDTLIIQATKEGLYTSRDYYVYDILDEASVRFIEEFEEMESMESSDASAAIGSEATLESVTSEPVVIENTEVQQEHTVIQEPAEEDFVKVVDYIPDLVVELRYATVNNFTGKQIYDFTDAYLRYGTVKKLMQVQTELQRNGLGLKIWDAFRPTEAQFALWEICPDPTYVSDPNKGFSSHSRGNTVDITLVTAEGKEIKMPTDYDDFSALADRDYSDIEKKAANQALYLEQLMKQNGFKAYHGEWWHYSDEQAYEVEELFEP